MGGIRAAYLFGPRCAAAEGAMTAVPEPAPTVRMMPIADIRAAARRRKDLRDIAGLAASIAEPHSCSRCGARRQADRRCAAAGSGQAARLQ
jgi:hypothetical protein